MTPIRKSLLTGILLLCITFGFLYDKLQTQRIHLEQSREIIEDELTIEDLQVHIQAFRSAYSSDDFIKTDMQKEIQASFLEFSDAVRSIYTYSEGSESIDAIWYFHEKIKITDHTKDHLWRAQEHLCKTLTKHLEAAAADENNFYGEMRTTALTRLTEINSHMNKVKDGTTMKFDYAFTLLDTSLVLPVTGRKIQDSINWEERYTAIQYYLNFLDYYSQSPDKKRVINLLSSIKHALGQRSKITVYSTTYDLSEMTRAEITSTYKHLLLLEYKLNQYFFQELIGLGL